MKKITARCIFAGKKVDIFEFRVGNPHSRFHPLYFQDLWLRTVRGGTIPKAVKINIEKLRSVASENETNFEDLISTSFKFEEKLLSDDDKIIDLKKFRERIPEAKADEIIKYKSFIKLNWHDAPQKKQDIVSNIALTILDAVGCKSKETLQLLSALLACDEYDITEFFLDIDYLMDLTYGHTKDFACQIAQTADVEGAYMTYDALCTIKTFLEKSLGDQLLSLLALYNALGQWAMLSKKAIPHTIPCDLCDLHKRLHGYFLPQKWKKKHEPTSEEMYSHANKLDTGKTGSAYGPALGILAWYQRSAYAGFAAAQTVLSGYFSDCGDFQRFREWAAKAAKQGDVIALYNIGHHYSQKEGHKPDYKKAIYYLEKAYKKGSQNAPGQIGWCYLNGSKEIRDYKKAKLWFEKAIIERDCKYAYFDMAEMYEKGLGVEKSAANALGHYMMASDRGIYKAQDAIIRLRKQNTQPL